MGLSQHNSEAKHHPAIQRTHIACLQLWMSKKMVESWSYVRWTPQLTRMHWMTRNGVNSKGRAGWLCAWKNSFLLSFANLRRQGWKTRRLRGLYFTNTPIHKIRRGKINDIYAVQESFLPTDCTFLRIAATSTPLAMHAMCLDMARATLLHFSAHTMTDLEAPYFRIFDKGSICMAGRRLVWISCLLENYKCVVSARPRSRHESQ
jgi:hypothetical protein